MILSSPIFLIGLVAIGIPIAIHLLQLRRYHKVYFSNVDALQELQNENRRQHQVRQWLVLAMRILTIVFLVLAFCRPVISRQQSDRQQEAINSQQAAVSVYLDNSYSMECGGMDGSLLESGRQKAREIVAAYRPDDRFQLLTSDAHGSQFRWLSRDEFLTELDRIEPSVATPMLSSIVRRQQDFLKKNSGTVNLQAYLISDFQRKTSDLVNIPVDSTILYTFIPLGGSNINNLYIDTLTFDSPAYSRGATATALVTVQNNGDKAVESVPLRLFLNGRLRAVASVDIPAGGNATVPLSISIDEEGALQGHVETVDYPITFDDRLYFTLNITHEIKMLVITPGSVGKEAENVYLSRLFAHDSLVNCQFMPAGHINYTGLTDHNMIVVDRLKEIPSGLSQTLQSFVEDGGTLLVIPDEKSDRDSYNRLLASLHAPRLGAWQNSRATVRDIDIDNRLFLSVFNGKTEDMELPTLNGYFIAEWDATTLREPILTLPDGNPYLTATQSGEGSVYLFTTPLEEEHSNFMLQTLFVPTLYNMALYSTPRQQPYHLAGATDPIPLITQNSKLTAIEVPHLRSTDSTVDLIPDIRRLGGHYMLIPHGEMLTAGNYRVGDEGISFNYSRAESDLTVYNATELQQLIGDLKIPNYSMVSNSRKSLTEQIRERNQGTPLWRWCLILALLALAAETFLLKRKCKN